jgi:hypothetical protein
MRIEISGDSRAWWRFSTDELRQLPRAFDFDFLHRVHRRDRQAENFENRGIFRFDPPIDRREEFGTLYASTSPAGALFEALGSIRPLPEHLVRERVITRLLVGDPFVIADLTVQGSGVFRTYGGLSGMHGCGAESHSCEHGHATMIM